MWHMPMTSSRDENVYNIDIESFFFLMRGVACKKLRHVNCFCQRTTKMVRLFLVSKERSGVERNVMW
jgi:hypothetical protein